MGKVIEITAYLCCPKVNILMNALLQEMTIAENEFAGQDDKALGRVAVEGAKTMVKQLRQFGRV